MRTVAVALLRDYAARTSPLVQVRLAGYVFVTRAASRVHVTFELHVFFPPVTLNSPTSILKIFSLLLCRKSIRSVLEVHHEKVWHENDNNDTVSK